jgi:hypothetical protein
MSTNDITQLLKSVQELQKDNFAFWEHLDFWIGTIIGLVGLYFAVRAFTEARQAKKEAVAAKQAAMEAGKTVRIQSITIDLSEISQKLDRIRMEITYSEARDLWSEISHKLFRITSPFKNDPGLKEQVSALRNAISQAKESLKAIRPSDATTTDVPGTTYFGIEGAFAEINNCVGDLLGLFENKTTNFGEDDSYERNE